MEHPPERPPGRATRVCSCRKWRFSGAPKLVAAAVLARAARFPSRAGCMRERRSSVAGQERRPAGATAACWCRLVICESVSNGWGRGSVAAPAAATPPHTSIAAGEARSPPSCPGRHELQRARNSPFSANTQGRCWAGRALWGGLPGRNMQPPTTLRRREGRRRLPCRSATPPGPPTAPVQISSRKGHHPPCPPRQLR